MKNVEGVFLGLYSQNIQSLEFMPIFWSQSQKLAGIFEISEKSGIIKCLMFCVSALVLLSSQKHNLCFHIIEILSYIFSEFVLPFPSSGLKLTDELDHSGQCV